MISGNGQRDHPGVGGRRLVRAAPGVAPGWRLNIHRRCTVHRHRPGSVHPGPRHTRAPARCSDRPSRLGSGAILAGQQAAGEPAKRRSASGGYAARLPGRPRLPGVAGRAAHILVGGTTASNIDVSAKLSAALPIFLIVVVGLAFILLTFAFRTILVPATSILGFLLSTAAALGAQVALFQWRAGPSLGR